MFNTSSLKPLNTLEEESAKQGSFYEILKYFLLMSVTEAYFIPFLPSIWEN